MTLALLGCIVAYIIAQLITSFSKGNHQKLVPPIGNLLIWDTETNGRPINWNAPLHDLDNWPNIISISWVKISPTGNILCKKTFYVNPEGFSGNVIASEIHGIKNETISKEGHPMIEVLLMFDSDVQDSKYLVAHNIEFDFAVTHAEYKRNNLDTQILSSNNKICTMKASTEFCKIKNKRGYKYPTLQELYQKIFSKTISGSHNSEIDAEACMMCFKELYNQKVIKF